MKRPGKEQFKKIVDFPARMHFSDKFLNKFLYIVVTAVLVDNSSKCKVSTKKSLIKGKGKHVMHSLPLLIILYGKQNKFPFITKSLSHVYDVSHIISTNIASENTKHVLQKNTFSS